MWHQVLQQAGRNPSYVVLSKYWTPSTSKLNFDDFCEILKCEKKTEEGELLRAFKKMDVNGDGYISFSELEKALTTVSTLRLFVYSKKKTKANCVHTVWIMVECKVACRLKFVGCRPRQKTVARPSCL